MAICSSKHLCKFPHKNMSFILYECVFLHKYVDFGMTHEKIRCFTSFAFYIYVLYKIKNLV